MKISLVTPVYNEEENINYFLENTIPILSKHFLDYEIIFVLDPSDDNSEKIILEHCKNNKRIKLITLSRRFGQPASILAGLHHCTGDVTTIIDVDLQDPPELLVEMKTTMLQEASDIILAKRKSKIGENLLRKFISSVGYWFIEKLSNTRIPNNVGEFRLFNRKILNYLISFEEKEFFLRGATSFVGFKTSFVDFHRISRKQGQTKYNKYIGSLKIGLDGIFLYSTKPLHIITIISFFLFLFSTVIFILYLILTSLKVFLFKYQFFIITLILLVSSLIFFSQGIVAEYIARIFSDIKKRPVFIIDKKINFDEKK